MDTVLLEVKKSRHCSSFPFYQEVSKYDSAMDFGYRVIWTYSMIKR